MYAIPPANGGHTVQPVPALFSTILLSHWLKQEQDEDDGKSS